MSSASKLSTSLEKKRVRDRRAQQNLRDKRNRQIMALQQQVKICNQTHGSSYVEDIIKTCHSLQKEIALLRARQESLRVLFQAWDVDLTQVTGVDTTPPPPCGLPPRQPRTPESPQFAGMHNLPASSDDTRAPDYPPSFVAAAQDTDMRDQLHIPGTKNDQQSWTELGTAGDRNQAAMDIESWDVQDCLPDVFELSNTDDIQAPSSAAPLTTGQAFPPTISHDPPSHGSQHTLEPSAQLFVLKEQTSSKTHMSLLPRCAEYGDSLSPRYSVDDVFHAWSTPFSGALSTQPASHGLDSFDHHVADLADEAPSTDTDLLQQCRSHPRSGDWARVPVLSLVDTTHMLRFAPWEVDSGLVVDAPDAPLPLDLLYQTQQNKLADAIRRAIQLQPCRDVERLAIGWVLYVFIKWRTQPSPERFRRLPAFFKPGMEQLRHPHPAFLDMVLWERIRSNMIRNHQAYDWVKVLKLFSCCLKVRWPRDEDFLISNDNGKLVICPKFFRRFMSEDGWGLTPGFAAQYPELLNGVDIAKISHLEV